MTDNTIYNNPLITRYASKEMQRAFSDEKRFKLWRKLWIALAESEMELGLNITPEQVAELKRYADDINYDLAEQYEKEVRHDVMAHVKAYGAQAKNAMPIIHLGATSCFVNCNAEVIMIDDALGIVLKKLVNVMDKLKKFALKYKELPALGFTHLQPAQLTTVGKRATLWLQDLEMDYQNLKHLKSCVKLRGVKGTTGTQASFLELFDGDEEKVKLLEEKVVEKMGYEKVYGVTGQTYPRKFDYNALCVLSQIAQSAYKFSNDIRLLQNMKEIEEPFEKNQIGSSAMAYKRNPMRCERVCSLSRYVVNLASNTADTAMTQWLERTLDDSANRRLTLPEGFLACDAILTLCANVVRGCKVYPRVMEKHLREELPFLATENILMRAVSLGEDRQKLHEVIRQYSVRAAESVKLRGEDGHLLDMLLADERFHLTPEALEELLDVRQFVGLAPEQTRAFLKTHVYPVLEARRGDIAGSVPVRV